MPDRLSDSHGACLMSRTLVVEDNASLRSSVSALCHRALSVSFSLGIHVI